MLKFEEFLIRKDIETIITNNIKEEENKNSKNNS